MLSLLSPNLRLKHVRVITSGVKRRIKAEYEKIMRKIRQTLKAHVSVMAGQIMLWIQLKFGIGGAHPREFLQQSWLISFHALLSNKHVLFSWFLLYTHLSAACPH